MQSSRYLILALQGAVLPPSRFEIPYELKLLKDRSRVTL
jgi:hypothetical protein